LAGLKTRGHMVVPRSGPGGNGPGFLHPRHRLGAGERVFGRVTAEFLANWIPPDVAGDFDDVVIRSQDMIVVAGLPQQLAGCLLEMKSGLLFEAADEFERVASWKRTFGKDVDMIWHETIGMNRE